MACSLDSDVEMETVNDRTNSDSQAESDTDQAAVALITGANKGIGHEIARQLGEHGLTVIASARNVQRGEKSVKELREDGIDAHFLQLDVTDESTVKAAARGIENEFGRLDVLVNNAGVSLDSSASEVATEIVSQTYEVNVFGVVTVTHVMLPLLRQSSAARVVNISSSLGSMAVLSDEESHISGLGMLSYCSSKAALNAITLIYANELRETNVLVNAVSPGYVATDLTNYDGEVSPERGARVPVEVATLPDDGPTGQFFSDHDTTGLSLSDNGTIPW